MTSIKIGSLPPTPWQQPLARILLTFPFWESAIDKLLRFHAAIAEMAHFDLRPPALYAIATIAVQLLGSVLIIARVYPWLSAGVLMVFTALTIPIAHHFWSLAGLEQLNALHMATEHVGLIGALMLSAVSATAGQGSSQRLEPTASARLP
jgi:transmembrane protein